MKLCPKCRREYEDDSLRFCLEDGTALATNDVAGTNSEATMVLPGNENVGATMSQVARPSVPLPDEPRERIRPTEPAAERSTRSSSSAATARITIAILSAIAIVLKLVGLAMWGLFAVRRLPLTLFFLGVMIVAFVRAARHPRASLLAGMALGLDLIGTFVYVAINRGLSSLVTAGTLTGKQLDNAFIVTSVIDDLWVAGILILLTMAVLTGRRSNSQTT